MKVIPDIKTAFCKSGTAYCPVAYRGAPCLAVKGECTPKSIQFQIDITHVELGHRYNIRAIDNHVYKCFKPYIFFSVVNECSY
ncbi:hypothetical protein TNIN_58411 [Trichonephila inaurata madagascariensis]|uniref:Uncharacterized protein n=1 Tax=Trichonephila inaurata madagascariensis TaxID=2747483 RepID=A0A8X7CF03_9ARAC|nr:hypothetical protein TNIN_58411 [Trichonephila inaurata madagascariensis]